MRISTTPARATLAALLFASVTAAGSTAEATHRQAQFRGEFQTTVAGSNLGYDIGGTATMKVRASRTTARVRVTGLERSLEYGAHLHNGTCADSGGGHYQDQDDGLGLETPPNELWISSRHNTALKPNRRGVAHGSGRAHWAARTTSDTQTNARSVVVHAPETGTRIACADLR